MVIGYKRVLLKISGEALAGLEIDSTNKQVNLGKCISNDILNKIATEVKEVHAMGIKVSVVVGGGNIYRGLNGSSADGIERCASDYMGMLATIINGVALHSALERNGVAARLMSSLPIPSVCEHFTFNKARHHLDRGRVVVFAGGTGNPYFTTDTAAALRAVEMSCDLLLKATKVPGIFDKDPNIYKDAKFLPHISYDELHMRKISIMDLTAVTFAQENHLPIGVFSLYTPNGFKEVLSGNGQFTLVK